MDIKTANERNIELKQKLNTIQKEQSIVRNHVVNYVVSLIENALDNTLKNKIQITIDRLYPNTPFSEYSPEHMPNYDNFLEDLKMFSQGFDCRRLTKAEIGLIINLYRKSGFVIEHNKEIENNSLPYDTFHISYNLISSVCIPVHENS